MLTLYEEFYFKEQSVDVKKLNRGGLVSYLSEIILKGNLRLGPITPELSEYVVKRVVDAVQNERPLKFCPTTGSYKNIYALGAPHINWAEVFQLSHLIECLYPISQVYEPGFEIEYSGDSFAMCFIDNLKPEWIERYNRELSLLCERVSKTALPTNITLSVKNIEQWYDMDDLEREVKERIAKTNQNDEAIRNLIDERLRYAENNYCFNGIFDYSEVDSDRRAKLFRESVLAHKYYLDIDFERRTDYLLGLGQIILVHRRGIPDCLPIISYPGNDVQYWEGVGVLRSKEEGGYTKSIMSPKQLEKLSTVEESVDNELVDISIGLKTIPIISSETS